MLLALGLNTATFTSPHLAHFGERYRYNGAAWTPEEFEAAMERLNVASQPPWRDALKAPHRFRTAFEFMTMAALVEFARRGRLLDSQTPPRRQVVCWETGLGGRLDCTNVVDPTVSVITTLGLDHTAILGDTIEQIAFEKAGIIKPGRPVVVARQAPEFAERVLPVLRRRAEEVKAPLCFAWETCPVEFLTAAPAGQQIEFRLPGGSRHGASLSLHGAFQRTNLEAALAATCLFLQSENFPFGEDLSERLAEGISRCHWPGRMEIVSSSSGQSLVLDGAHCPLSAEAAVRTVASWQDKSILPIGAPIELLCSCEMPRLTSSARSIPIA
jgi:dihydrofolate synthase/folylpolyglutamate synthase